MVTALVTGGAGFIGSHLCDYLLKTGHRVICVDNLGSGTKDNIKHLLKNKNFKFIKHNVIFPLEINEKIDYIYHLASRASPIDYQEHPVETALTNSVGTYNMLKLALRKDATLLFASTSEAYGTPKIHPQTEEYWGNVNPVGVRSCYDESKRFGEALLMSFYREYKAKIKIVRIFNTYGPRLRKNDGRVISNFIIQALANKPITIYGDGSQTRSFCYVSDMVEGIYKMMHSGWIGPKNLGNPHEVTVLEIAKQIKKLSKSNSKIIFKPLPQDDPTKRQPDISKARSMLGWHPVVGLEEGLKTTIDWFKQSKSY
jgi:dTDP-glucose 4,6-dehydratase